MAETRRSNYRPKTGMDEEEDDEWETDDPKKMGFVQVQIDPKCVFEGYTALI